MLTLSHTSPPEQHSGYWRQDAQFIAVNGGDALTATVYQPGGEWTDFLSRGVQPQRTTILCPGFLESRRQPGIVALAAAFAQHDTHVLTFDPRGTHESNAEGRAYCPDQTVIDMANLAIAMCGTTSPERLILGGRSMGGALALRAALNLQARGILPTHAFTVKTPHHPQAHTPFATFMARSHRPFFGPDEHGKLVRERITMTEGAFTRHESTGDLAELVGQLGKVANPPRILLAASAADTELPSEPLQEIAARYNGYVTFAQVAGTHSERTPSTVAETARIVAQWYQTT